MYPQAHGGDYRLFEKIDADANGQLTAKEWLSYLKAHHEDLSRKSLKKADTWLDSLLFTLKRGCGVMDLAKAQAAEAELAFARLMKLTPGAETVPREELVAACNNYYTFEALECNRAGAATEDQWSAFVEVPTEPEIRSPEMACALSAPFPFFVYVGGAPAPGRTRRSRGIGSLAGGCGRRPEPARGVRPTSVRQGSGHGGGRGGRRAHPGAGGGGGGGVRAGVPAGGARWSDSPGRHRGGPGRGLQG